ncbi:abscisic acid receptor PYL10-like [Oryza brachyantha]|uniref:abscisic acid receptor PYL10-like n=1 Tax=Oryza brachyantha TaxID=4533 RepID=UPI001ADC95AB|nr:abscisic acid receptor PYL10-like [Oryza brachyantha]
MEQKQQQEQQAEAPPPGLGLTAAEYTQLRPTVEAHHRYAVGPGQCSSLLAQRIHAPAAAVWAVVRRFDCPQVYKHFIRSCVLRPDPDSGSDDLRPGRLREVSVISGLPASTSTERLDLLDDARRVFGFTITGGEHRLRNYRSVTTVSDLSDDQICTTVVLESYIVDVPEGNTEEDTRLFADTVIRLNLQKLKSVSEANAAAAAAAPPPPAAE